MGRFWEEDRFAPVGRSKTITQTPRSAPFRSQAFNPETANLEPTIRGGVAGGLRLFDQYQKYQDHLDFIRRVGHAMRNENFATQVPEGQKVNITVFNIGTENESQQLSVGFWPPYLSSPSSGKPFKSTITGTNPNLESMPDHVITRGPEGEPRITPVTTKLSPFGSSAPLIRNGLQNAIDREPHHARDYTSPVESGGFLPADARIDETYPQAFDRNA